MVFYFQPIAYRKGCTTRKTCSMKIIVLIVITIITLTVLTTQAQGIPAGNPIVAAAQAEIKARKSDLSQAGGYTPFRLTLDELTMGIVYYNEGVYFFPETIRTEFGNKNFGMILAMFRSNHKRLEPEIAVQGYGVDSQSKASIKGYFVTFREKE